MNSNGSLSDHLVASRVDHDLIYAALEAESEEDIRAICTQLCKELCFDHFLYGVMLPTSFIQPSILVVSNYPQAWWDRYEAKAYVKVDPVVSHCRSHLTPIAWGPNTAIADHPKEREMKLLMQEASDFGLCSGISFPVYGNAGEFAILSLASSRSKEKSSCYIGQAMSRIPLILGYIQENVRKVMTGVDKFGRDVALTDREKECLTWAAEGKTNWEVSRILRVSERTVTFHLQNATEKLQVSNRYHAVAKAVSQSLILPELG